jgi:hypothetical protein
MIINYDPVKGGSNQNGFKIDCDLLGSQRLCVYYLVDEIASRADGCS